MVAIQATGGGIFQDVITWVRRLIKSSSASEISDAVIADYINRFVSYEVAERIELFELRRQYTFETIPNVFTYQAPFVSASVPNWPQTALSPPFIQNTALVNSVTQVPVYQTFRPPMYCDGVLMDYHQSNQQFYNLFPEYVNNEIPLLGSGNALTTYTTGVGQTPILQGYIDDLGNNTPYVYITALNSAGQQQYIVDCGTVVNNVGTLVQTDSTFNNILGPLPSAGGSGTVNYLTGQLSFTFVDAVPSGTNIETQTSPFSPGFPRIALFYNNIFKLYPVPDRAYKIQVEGNVTPSVFFNTAAAMPFAYMSEYFARGAARKILSDTGDVEQFQFYEPFFREQENLVLRRTSRQNSVRRTPTIYSTNNRSPNSWWGWGGN